MKKLLVVLAVVMVIFSSVVSAEVTIGSVNGRGGYHCSGSCSTGNMNVETRLYSSGGKIRGYTIINGVRTDYPERSVNPDLQNRGINLLILLKTGSSVITPMVIKPRIKVLEIQPHLLRQKERSKIDPLPVNKDRKTNGKVRILTKEEVSELFNSP